MTSHRIAVALACALALGATVPVATAAPVTSLSAFLAAAPGPVGVLDFEGLAPGTDLSGATHWVEGGPGTGVTFPAFALDFQDLTVRLQVAQNMGGSNPTTSGLNSLGTDDAGNFNLLGAGTGFSLRMTDKVHAFGMSFITPDDMRDDDIRLSADGDLATLEVAQRSVVDVVAGVTYYAYFLGLVSSVGFDQVTIGYGPDVLGGPFLYNIDDIRVSRATTAVPEPGSLALSALAFGLMGAAALRRRAS
jgi:PEP-CTERM motif